MENLHPTAPAPEGGQNAFDAGEKTLASFPIPELLKRIDTTLLVLKSCKGTDIPCYKPWAQLHPNGEVKNLRDVMQDRWDNKYHKLYEDYKVRFTKCNKSGRIDIKAEGPQWTDDGPIARGQAMVLFNNITDPDEWSTPSNGTSVDENWVIGKGGEEEGWWDDWERAGGEN